MCGCGKSTEEKQSVQEEEAAGVQHNEELRIETHFQGGSKGSNRPWLDALKEDISKLFQFRNIRLHKRHIRFSCSVLFTHKAHFKVDL